MQQLLLLSLVSVSSSLKCKDIIIGEIGGTSFNFVNTLKCPAETKWCMNVNVSFNSLIDGLFGNCETNGLIKPLLNFTTVFGDISCKTAGCESFPMINATRCCCNTDLCNPSSKFTIFFTIFVPFLIKLLS